MKKASKKVAYKQMTPAEKSKALDASLKVLRHEKVTEEEVELWKRYSHFILKGE